MAYILNIDTSTSICSVSLSKDGKSLSLRESEAPNTHSSLLTVFIQDVCNEVALDYPDLDAVSVSMGPGSYTGLRIGVAAAKGLCYALDKPLIAIPTLEALAIGMKVSLAGQRCLSPKEKWNNFLKNDSCSPLFCPMIDARRMEVYCAIYQENLKEICPTKAVIVDEYTFNDLLSDYTICFAGNGAEKCLKFLSGKPNTLFIKDFQASAIFMIELAEKRFQENRFEDLAYFEPFYLKDFVAGKPKVKGLY